MKYTVVALLIAALTPSAVLAQSPRRESPPSPRPKNQGQSVEVPVTPQPDAPLRLSVQGSRLGDSGWHAGLSLYRMRASVENVSHRDIGLYTLRRGAVGSNRYVGRRSKNIRLPGFSLPGKALRPGEVDVTEAEAPILSHLFPKITYEVESVVFMDGTIWCTDECRMAEYAAGDLAGGRAVVSRLLKVLEQGGLDAVINALREKVAEDDPVPAVQVTTGELVDIKPPPGRPPHWEEGFRKAAKWVADILWVQYVHHGTGQIERTLRDAYSVAEAK